MRQLIIIVLLVFTSSCATDIYYLNLESNAPVVGYKISGPYEVVKINENSVFLKKNAITSLKKFNKTQLEESYTVKIQSGDSLRFHLRTTRVDYPRESGIIFDLTSNGCSLKHQGKILAAADSVFITPGVDCLVKIINEGKNLKIYVDCAELFNGRIERNLTEYTIIKSINTEAEIKAIENNSVY